MLQRALVMMAVLGFASVGAAEERSDLRPEAESLNAPAPAALPGHLTPRDTAARPTEAAPAKRTTLKRLNGSCNANGCGYRALLGSLVITRDLAVSETMAVRFLPTGGSLGGGDSRPIVVRPRVTGNGDSYGLQLRARF